ncbi:hypothetical protein ACIPYS_09580 [Kitasatospora sp. NPDC089913]|uniref:hypothetical protein n=1 Tax=Kitasatospora sp. NPDC089913 TaxID=3364080 RepID=UPI00381482B3
MRKLISKVISKVAPKAGKEASSKPASKPRSLGTYRENGKSGKDLRRSTTASNGQEWNFNTGHGFYRAHKEGTPEENWLQLDTDLTPDEIEEAIAGDVEAFQAAGGAVPALGKGSKELTRNVNVLRRTGEGIRSRLAPATSGTLPLPRRTSRNGTAWAWASLLGVPGERGQECGLLVRQLSVGAGRRLLA